MSRIVDVVVTYLETAAHPSLSNSLPPGIAVRHELPPHAADIAAAMYHAVGANWDWHDRRGWTDEQWRDAIHADDVELWTARIGETLIGYFELHVEDAAVDIKYFGLTPEFTGRGIGGPLLSAAIQRASSLGRGRVTVNTCTLDHPAALANYLARGFRIIRTEKQRRTIPA